jgi:hypothetical protein
MADPIAAGAACGSVVLILWGAALCLYETFASAPVAAGDDAELVEPALERAVPQRRAA